MVRLSSDHVLKENQTGDPGTISTLALTHKALSDVSCLSGFKNLEKLDLRMNSLTSLEGLKECVNLKWLSVVENKLESLNGIEGLSGLTVLNAGKNKLRSMDELKPVVSLRAIILNDNQIGSICRLDQMKELNTLVLSRNPISEIGESLVKVKSITKLSLSYCQLQTIGSSLKSCTELKELRLAHNDIKTIPTELAHNKKLQNLDLGNNSITSQSALEVLNSLGNLKNLNLQGNPLSEKDKLMNKVKKLLPNLQILNARPIDRYTKNKKGDRAVKAVHKFEVLKQEKTDHIGEKNFKHHDRDESEDASGLYMEKEPKQETKKTKEKHSKKEVLVHETIDTKDERKPKRKSKVKQDELDVIDNGETSFLELLAVNNANSMHTQENTDRAVKEADANGGLVTFPPKRKKTKSLSTGASELQISMSDVIGMGGPSTWDN